MMMIDKVLKEIVDIFFMTKRTKNKFERDNPDEKVLAADGSKGIITKTNQDIQRGVGWIASQRAVLLLTDKRIVCGKWTIPLDTIVGMQLLKIKALFTNGQVLKVETDDGTNYQFGMQINPEWTNQQIFPLALEKGQVKNSLFSIIIRVMAVAYLLYMLFEWLISQ